MSFYKISTDVRQIWGADLEKNDIAVSIGQRKANISIDKAHQTATRNGRKEWIRSTRLGKM